MQLLWGSYPFVANSCEITNRTEAVLSEWSGLPMRYDTEWEVKAWLDATGDQAITVLENQVRAALAVPYQDFKFLTNESTYSSLTLLNNQTMSGLRTKDVRVEEADSKEYTTTRTVRFKIVGSYAIGSIVNALVSYRETVTIIGNGGPRRVWRFPINPPSIAYAVNPVFSTGGGNGGDLGNLIGTNVSAVLIPGSAGVRQTLTPASLVTAIQTGEAVGHQARPSPPPGLFPGYQVNESIKFASSNPRWLGKAFVNFGITWEYRFERGDGPLFGFPIIPPQYLNLTS